ncbi:MAG: hypothetical protein SGBAC_010314, partial [Bacillariaceae sp.]
NTESSTSKTTRQDDWPSYNDVLQDVRKTNYNEILTCPADIHPISEGREKTICPQGVVCCAKLELFPFPHDVKGNPYSGLLRPGSTAEHCIIRLSSALQPMNSDDQNNKLATMFLGKRLANAKLFPAVAIKMFRGNRVESGNMLFLGCKVGQEEDDFFAHCLCTQITSSMPTTLKPILNLFKKYSATPLLLGNSNLCSFDTDGEVSNDFNFPFCLTLKPRVEKGARFLDEVLDLPAGAHLYDLFASPDPLSVADGRKLQRIGRIVTTSEMMPSTRSDGLFFRHQKKDEDFKFKPHWKSELQTKVRLKTGRKGTVASVAGWKLFEHQIADGGYVDFEASERS